MERSKDNFFVPRDCDHLASSGLSTITLDHANAILRDFIERERCVLYGSVTVGPNNEWTRAALAEVTTHQGDLLFVEEVKP